MMADLAAINDTKSVFRTDNTNDLRKKSVSDRKSIAIAIGTAVGIAAVATVVGLYVAKNQDNSKTVDVNDVFEQAKLTVKKLNDAVEFLRKSTAA